MAPTTSLGPESEVVVLSQTSRMNSQFSDVRFSSVARATASSKGEVCVRNMLGEVVVSQVMGAQDQVRRQIRRWCNFRDRLGVDADARR